MCKKQSILLPGFEVPSNLQQNMALYQSELPISISEILANEIFFPSLNRPSCFQNFSKSSCSASHYSKYVVGIIGFDDRRGTTSSWNVTQ